jgi:FkbM family methyltransferase
VEKKHRLVEYCKWKNGDQIETQFGVSTAVIFYGQHGEDLEVYIDFISKDLATFKNGGTYIELGASDGVKFSNTKFFEEELGFKGILIEPVPEMFETLKRTRPSNCLYNCVVSPQKDPVSFLVGGGMGGPWVSGVEATMSPAARARAYANPESDIANSMYVSRSIDVETKKLSSLMKENDMRYVDLLSIDVEGGEYEVLKTIDWNIPIYLIVVELDGLDLDKDHLCRELLKKNGYAFHKTVGVSEIWYDSEYMPKRQKAFNDVYTQKRGEE